jgi:hypothetical protein
MLEFARLVDRAFLPSIAVGLVLSLAWRFIQVGPARTLLQWIGSLFFFVPQPFALFLGAYTAGLRLYQQTLLSLWGFGTLAVLAARVFSRPGPVAPGRLRRVRYWRETPEEVQKTEGILAAVRTRPPRPHNRLVFGMAALLMGGLGVWCGWTTVGDYLLPHRVVAGRVKGARVVHGTRSPNTYRVIIDDHSYNITRDLLARLRPGDLVAADVGVASETILAIQSAVHPSQAEIPRQ